MLKIHLNVLSLIILLFSTSLLADNAAIPLALSNNHATRDVTDYTLKENELRHDIVKNKVNALSDNFEVLLNNASDWKTKEEWMDLARKKSSGTIQNLNVRYLDDLVMVCFSVNYKEKKKVKTDFIVDIWRKSTDKLEIRYESTHPMPQSLFQVRK